MVKKEIFGLDISDYSIEALALSKPFFGKPKISAYARTILRGEVVVNGVIKNKKKLQDSLVKLLDSARPQAIRTPFCVLSLPDSQIFTTIFKLPAGLKHQEIKNTIPYKAEEVIPFKSSEVYYDFKTITVQGESQEVFYAAVPVKVVNDYVDVLKAVGLKPIAFDLESLSLARALVDVDGKKKGAKLLLDIGARTTNFNIFDLNGIRQSLVIKIAGNRFTRSIMSSAKLTEKQADELKIKTGFDDKKGDRKVVTILQTEFKKIIEEAQKLIDFYQAENQRQITEVILAGGSSLLPKVDQYLADSLKLAVNVGDPLAKIYDPGALIGVKNKAIIFTNVVGLALRGIEPRPETSDINLLPVPSKRLQLLPEPGDRKHWRRFFIRLGILLLALAILIAVIFIKQQGGDFYRQLFPQQSEGKFVPVDINFELLEQLRQQELEKQQATTTSQFKVRILPTSAGYANVREGAGAEFVKIGEAPSGSEYELLEPGEDWHKIKFSNELSGWIFSTFAEIFQVPTSTLNAATTSPAKNTPAVLGESTDNLSQIKIRSNSLGFLNVRQGPGTNFSKLGDVKVDQIFDIVDQSADWYQIKLADGQLGWVYGAYVDLVEKP